MNCHNCKNFVFGRCTVTNFMVSPDMLCNAWELSASYEQVKLPYATFDEKEFQKRIAELEESSICIEYLNEDELPECISDEIYSAMYECSKVDFVRLFPYVTVDGYKLFLIKLPEESEI